MAKKSKSLLICVVFAAFFCLLCACSPPEGDNSSQTLLFSNAEQIDDISYDGVFAACTGGKWQLYNAEGKAVNSEKYDFLTYAGNGKFRFQQNDTWGFTDCRGEISFATTGYFDSQLYPDDKNILLYKNRVSGKIGYGIYILDRNYNRYLGADFLYAVTAPSAKKFGIYCAASGGRYVLKSYLNDAVSIPFNEDDRLDYATYYNYVLITPAASPSALSKTYSLESGLLLFSQGNHIDNGYIYHGGASYDKGGVFYKTDDDARTVRILSSVSVTLPLDDSPQAFPNMLLAATKDRLLIERNVYAYEENGVGKYQGQIDLTSSYFKTHYRGKDAEGRSAIFDSDLKIVANASVIKMLSYTPDSRSWDRFLFCDNGIYDRQFQKIVALDQAQTIESLPPVSEGDPIRFVKITQAQGCRELLFDCKQKKIVSRVFDPDDVASTPFVGIDGRFFFLTAAGDAPASGYILTEESGALLTSGTRIRFDPKGCVALIYGDAACKQPVSCLSLRDTRVSASASLISRFRENPSFSSYYAVRSRLYLVCEIDNQIICYDQSGTCVFPEAWKVRELISIYAFKAYDVFLISDGEQYRTMRYRDGERDAVDAAPVSDCVFPFAQTTLSSQTKFITPKGFFSASVRGCTPLSTVGDCAIVRSGDRYGVVNLKGEYALPLLYQNVQTIEGDFVLATHFNASPDVYDCELNLLYSDITAYFSVSDSGAPACTLTAIRKKEGGYALYRTERPYVAVQIK